MFYLRQKYWFSVLKHCFELTPRENIFRFKMSRIDKILMTDKEIGDQIKSLMCQVSDVENEIVNKFLIKRLYKENKELEEEILKFRDELIHLEKLCGRTPVNLCSSKENDISDERPKPVQEVSQPSRDDKVNSKTEIKKNPKKSDKTVGSKKGTADSKNTAGEELPIDIGRLDLKVGKIIDIDKHPDADSLYVEKVDIGRAEPITVVSGLVKHIPANDLKDSLVIILCNLKPAKMRGVTSEGMVMCASCEQGVEVLRPPSGSLPGDVVSCPGFKLNPDPVMNPKKKIFETVAPDLKTDYEMVATYKGIRWIVGEKGVVKAQTLKEVNIK